MSLKETKKQLEEATRIEGNQGIKESLLAIGVSLLLGVGGYLYGSHMAEAGKHLGRMQILDKLTKAADELDSIDENINKN